MQRHEIQSTCYTGIPTGVDICVQKNDCKIRADLKANCKKNVLIWGYVCDCNNKPIEGTLVHLLQYIGSCTNDVRPVCQVYTDCKGYYQFDLPANSEGEYRVVVSPTRCNPSRTPRNYSYESSRDYVPSGCSYYESDQRGSYAAYDDDDRDCSVRRPCNCNEPRRSRPCCDDSRRANVIYY